MAKSLYPSDKKILLSVGDGPEHIEIYTSEEEGVVNFSPALPGLYLTASCQDAYIKLGPFQLETIREGIIERLKEVSE